MVLEDVKAMRFSTIEKKHLLSVLILKLLKVVRNRLRIISIKEASIKKRVKKSCILIGMVKSKVAKEKDVIWKLLVNLLSKVIILIKLWI